MKINIGDEISIKNKDGSFIYSRSEIDKHFARKIRKSGGLQKKEIQFDLEDVTEKQTIIGPPPILTESKGEI